MRKFVMTTAAIAMAMMPAVAATDITAGVSRADMDLSVNPGDDFYEYAGGGWMKANPLRPEFSRYGVFDLLAERNQENLRDLFLDLAKWTATA